MLGLCFYPKSPNMDYIYRTQIYVYVQKQGLRKIPMFSIHDIFPTVKAESSDSAFELVNYL